MMAPLSAEFDTSPNYECDLLGMSEGHRQIQAWLWQLRREGLAGGRQTLALYHSLLNCYSGRMEIRHRNYVVWNTRIVTATRFRVDARVSTIPGALADDAAASAPPAPKGGAAPPSRHPVQLDEGMHFDETTGEWELDDPAVLCRWYRADAEHLPHGIVLTLQSGLQRRRVFAPQLQRRTGSWCLTTRDDRPVTFAASPWEA